MLDTAMARAQVQTAQFLSGWSRGILDGWARRRSERGTLPLARARPRHFYVLVIVGILLFAGGLLVFGHYQTQALFKDFSGIDDARGGILPRNDGGIVFGALVAAGGLGAILWALNPYPQRRRLLPLAGFLVSLAFILVAHFSIFVNGWSVPQARVLAMQTSFLFHDTAATTHINTFALAFFTLLVLLVGLACLIGFLTPNILRSRILSPNTLPEHRTRLVLITLLLLAVGATFARQFLAYAVRADALPEDAFLTTNLTAVYYLLGFTLIIALLVAGWRTALITWGPLVERTTRRFQSGHRVLMHIEWWIWGAILLLNLVIFTAPPAYTPAAELDRVFMMNSKGVSLFFLLILPIYVLHRRLSRIQLGLLRRTRTSRPQPVTDRLLTLSVLAIALWIGGSLLGPMTDLSPLTTLTLRTLPIALLLILFSVRVRIDEYLSLTTSHAGAPLMLFAGAALAFLTGIMLWGAGNSVTVLYSQHSGGFLTPEGRLLQPYVTGIRLLGALCIVLPTMILMWLLVNRSPKQRAVPPGPLFVSGLAFMFAMNLLLTIDPTGRFDASLGYTDVLIGFWILLLQTNMDILVMSLVWVAATGIGLFYAAFALRNGVDMPPKSQGLHPAAAPEKRVGGKPKPHIGVR